MTMKTLVASQQCEHQSTDLTGSPLSQVRQAPGTGLAVRVPNCGAELLRVHVRQPQYRCIGALRRPLDFVKLLRLAQS